MNILYLKSSLASTVSSFLGDEPFAIFADFSTGIFLRSSVCFGLRTNVVAGISFPFSGAAVFGIPFPFPGGLKLLSSSVSYPYELDVLSYSSFGSTFFAIAVDREFLSALTLPSPFSLSSASYCDFSRFCLNLSFTLCATSALGGAFRNGGFLSSFSYFRSQSFYTATSV